MMSDTAKIRFENWNWVEYQTQQYVDKQFKEREKVAPRARELAHSRLGF